MELSINNQTVHSPPNKIHSFLLNLLSPEEKKTLSTTLLFYLNGKRIFLEKANPEDSLYSFLQSQGLTGTKKGCGEGGCCACSVLLSFWESEKQKVKHAGVTSCLIPLGMVDHCMITTIEGIGSIKKGLHIIQDRIAKTHSTQCGYCTPGIVMSLYSLLSSNPHPKIVDIEESLGGNLCRCTGYRPIMEAAASFAVDFDPKAVSDITQNTYDMYQQEFLENKNDYVALEFPNELKTPFPSLIIIGEYVTWCRVDKIETLLKLFDPKQQPTPDILSDQMFDHPHQSNDIEFIAGYSDLGYKRNYGKNFPRLMISLHHIPELTQMSYNDKGICIGSAVTISDFNNFCKDLLENVNFNQNQTKFLSCFISQSSWFANHFVRNVATLGGSIVAADALSDLYPLWLASNSCVTIAAANEGKREMLLSQYMKDQHKYKNWLLLSLFTPWSNVNTYTQAYKIAKRKEDCQSTVTCCFTVEYKDKVINSQFSIGAVAKTTILCYHLNDFWKNKTWNTNNFIESLESLAKDITYNPKFGHKELREALVNSVYYKFYLYVSSQLGLSIPSRCLTCLQPYQHILRKSHQEFDLIMSKDNTTSAGRPFMHQSAESHTTGEAIYCGDIPFPPNGVYISLVQSKRAHANIINIDDSKLKNIKGVIGIFLAKDIPGRNLLGCLVVDEEVLASSTVHYYGQPIAIIAANNPDLAIEARDLVEVTYEDLPFIQDIDVAIEQKAYYNDWHRTIERGDLKEGYSNSTAIAEGTYRTGPQEHWYIETQNCTIFPGSDVYTVYAASQNAGKMQDAVSIVLNMPLNRVVVKTMRLGGGFGGKQDRPQFFVSHAAIVAYHLQVPVRFVLDRYLDMTISGMRHGFRGDYKIGVDNNGKIQSLALKYYNNAGLSLDLSSAVMDRGMWSAENSYCIPHLSLKGSCCQTNRVSNTAFRGFGVPQCVAVCEMAIEHAAYISKIPVDTIRYANLYKAGDPTSTGFKLRECNSRKCWEQLYQSANIKERRQEIEKFNNENKYVKKGLAIMPCRSSTFFEAAFMDTAGCLVQIFRDGSVHVTHSGIEMGQGIHTKMSIIAAETLGVNYDLIFTGPTETDKVPNTHPTAASSGTDLNGWAVHNACIILNERLQPLKDANPSMSWKELIHTAYFKKINLCANGHFAAPDFVYDYNTKKGRTSWYFVWNCISVEVELDILTGQFTTNRVDIVQDAGKSLDPAIDIGQLEGAFIQGLGLFTMEEPIWAKDGHLRTRNCSTYKIPTCLDAPLSFNISLLKDSPNKLGGILSQKTLGEAGVQSAFCVVLALRNAIFDYRSREMNLTDFFYFPAPTTMEVIRALCPVDFKNISI